MGTFWKLEATWLKNKINHLKKNEINVDSLKKDYKTPSDQRRVIEQAKFTCLLLGKALEKQSIRNWGSRWKADKLKCMENN